MEKWICGVCGYVYDEEIGDPDSGIDPGTKFADIPEDWICPLCGVGKDQFEKEAQKKAFHIIVWKAFSIRKTSPSISGSVAKFKFKLAS